MCSAFVFPQWCLSTHGCIPSEPIDLCGFNLLKCCPTGCFSNEGKFFLLQTFTSMTYSSLFISNRSNRTSPLISPSATCVRKSFLTSKIHDSLNRETHFQHSSEFSILEIGKKMSTSKWIRGHGENKDSETHNSTFTFILLARATLQEFCFTKHNLNFLSIYMVIAVTKFETRNIPVTLKLKRNSL